MSSLSTKLVTGDGRDITVADAVKLYKEEFSRSIPVGGRIRRLDEDNYSITAQFNTVDFETLDSVKICQTYHLSPSDNSIKRIPGRLQVTQIASAISNNSQYQAYLRQSDTTKAQLLDIWNESHLSKTINIAELDTHGDIISGGVFGSFVWSSFGDQDKLLYVCQKKKWKSPSFFDNSGSQDIDRGGEFVKHDDWGEGLAGIEHTMVAILDVAKNYDIKIVNYERYSLANPQWFGQSKVVFTAFKEIPRRHGLYGSNSRPSSIFIYDNESNSTDVIISRKSECCHTPRVNNLGDKFLYLNNAEYGVHTHAVKLFIFYPKTGEDKQLLARYTNKSEFFVQQLPTNCFTSDDKNILLVMTEHLKQYICIFSLEDERLIDINFEHPGVSVFDFRHDMILVSGSDIHKYPGLCVGSLDLSNIGHSIRWSVIELCSLVDEIDYVPIELPTLDKSTFLSGLLIEPKLRSPQASDEKLHKRELIRKINKFPTVVVIHGGPHNTMVARYMPTFVVYARLGLRTLCINYRGSIGVSEEYTQSLCGNMNDIDVKDCLHFIRELVKRGTLDKDKLIVQGNSHGGFIACHLTCQKEFMFTSAIIKNPVIDISAMHYWTDVHDWVFAECLGYKHYDFVKVPTTEELVKMYECSPITKASEAYVPTLMLLGSEDKCVHMSQGRRWIDILAARGVGTLCKVYADGHGLSEEKSDADLTITAIIWILKHLPR